MKLRIKLLGLVVYAVIASSAVLAGGGMMASEPLPDDNLAGAHCPHGHAKG